MGQSVERESAFIARSEIGVIRENGPRFLCAAAPVESGLKVDLKIDHESAGSVQQEEPRIFALDGAASESEHEFLGREQALDGRVFKVTKGVLAGVGKDLGDGFPRLGLDDIVDINELPVEAPGQYRAESRFTRAHEPGQDDAFRRNVWLRGIEPGYPIQGMELIWVLSEHHDNRSRGNKETTGDGGDCQLLAEQQPGKEHDQRDAELVERGDARSGAELQSAEVAQPR